VLYRRRLIAPKLTGNAQVVHVSIVMAHAEDEVRSPRISGYADDGAVGSAMPLDLHPIANKWESAANRCCMEQFPLTSSCAS
jgi:hypothetical protein